MEVTHLLSLKVMRVSKPSLATAAQPFFSTSPLLSAHASASLLSLQGSRPLPGHPKTLRDFALSELLTLPSTFGAISLGETFSSAFCINNECEYDVTGITLKMEVQTVTAKIPLAEFGGPDKILKPNEPLEGVVSHEIKELNQHVLACTVSYLLPEALGSSHGTGPVEDPERPNLRTFRKYYKFTVTNPLSVKTKVHTPKSPSAIMSAAEREKVFLEIHVQNLTSEPLSFERMHLDCVDGWEAEDINVWSPEVTKEDSPTAVTSIFSGATAIMQPQDTRQYLFILSPKPETIPSFSITHQPGAVIPLGRLDISWRTGRLLTSVLSRRIPLVATPPPVPAPAIPPHLQQAVRPQSPGPNAHRPGSPAFRVRNQPPPRSQSPTTPASPNPQHIHRPDIEVDLVVQNISRDEVVVEKPFKIDLTLTVSAHLPSTAWPRPGAITPAQASVPRDRVLRLIMQHIVPPRPAAISQSLANAQNATIAPEPTPAPRPQHTAPYSLRRSYSNISLARRSDSTAWGDAGSTTSEIVTITTPTLAQSPTAMSHEDATERAKTALPSPFKEVSAVAASRPGQQPEATEKEEPAVIFLGSSTLKLPAFRLLASSPAPTPEGDHPRGQVSANFSLEYIALREGFASVGGLRALLVEDREIPTDVEKVEEHKEDRIEPKVIREWDLIAEVWVKRS